MGLMPIASVVTIGTICSAEIRLGPLRHGLNKVLPRLTTIKQ